MLINFHFFTANGRGKGRSQSKLNHETANSTNGLNENDDIIGTSTSSRKSRQNRISSRSSEWIIRFIQGIRIGT